MDIPWDDIRLFLAIAESGSLSRGARALRVGQPTVSRRLADLEHRLGYELFERRASGASLTLEGERLLAPARKMAEWAGEIGRAAAASDAGPVGVVRIAAPPLVAFDFVAPFSAFVRARHPGLRIEALSSVAYVDVGRGEADLALRARAPQGEGLRLLDTLQHRNVAFSSSSYAAGLPRGCGIADVDWVAWAPPLDDVPPNPQLRALIPDFRPSFSSDNFLVLLRAVEAGLGAMVLGDIRHRFRRASGLVPLPLPLGPHERGEMHLVCAPRALEVPRVRVVAELLVEELAHARAAASA